MWSCSSRPKKPWLLSRMFGQVFLKKLPWVSEMEDNKPHGAFAVHVGLIGFQLRDCGIVIGSSENINEGYPGF